MTLLEKIKKNLIIEYDNDDELIEMYIAAAITYAESYQHKTDRYYSEKEMSPATEYAVIILATHFYESRDGSTGGFFSDNVQAGQRVWETVNILLNTDKNWNV